MRRWVVVYCTSNKIKLSGFFEKRTELVALAPTKFAPTWFKFTTERWTGVKFTKRMTRCETWLNRILFQRRNFFIQPYFEIRIHRLVKKFDFFCIFLASIDSKNSKRKGLVYGKKFFMRKLLLFVEIFRKFQNQNNNKICEYYY